MSSEEPRRSARLATKTHVPYGEEQIITIPNAKPKRVCKPIQEPSRIVHKPSLIDITSFMESYPAVLQEALSIREALGAARKEEEFIAIAKRCDDLWNKAHSVVSGMDKMFLSDCMRYCNEAKLGTEEHKYAINSIKYYISSIYDRVKYFTSFIE
jgi:hypothetical protein